MAHISYLKKLLTLYTLFITITLAYYFYCFIVLDNRLDANDHDIFAKATSISSWIHHEVYKLDWEYFCSSDDHLKLDKLNYDLSKKIRLAGTFIAYSNKDSDIMNKERLAILDDLSNNEQHLVKEGDHLYKATIKEIQKDYLIFQFSNMRECTLYISYKSPGTSYSTAKNSMNSTNESTAVLLSNKYGKRVGEHRWIINKDSILEYYQAMLEDPERLALLYLSFKPEYDSGSIIGYNLDIEGEHGFLESIGLKQNDRIKRVNSLNMTSQRRAEYFIGEFLNNRVNAIVIDLERSGKAKKLVYLIR
jgi:type II secretory pathway component PulC